MEKNERMPIPAEKVSLFRKIYNKLFSKKQVGESEISKIAEGLSQRDLATLEVSPEKQYVPDKRTVVYDFFDNLYNHDYYKLSRDKEFSETITYKNSQGEEREFSLYTTCGRLLEKIGINGINILPYERGVSNWLYYEEKTVHVFSEMVKLIEYDKFINGNNEDRIFVNEMGRIITEVSEKYGSSDVAGKKIYKLLNRNPIYSSIKDSFGRAYREYCETVVKFRSDERDRKEKFDKKTSFSDGIKVENVEGLKHCNAPTTQENKDTEREE